MSSELSAYYPTPGLSTIYFVVTRAPRQGWDGSAFETLDPSHWPSYKIAGSDPSGVGIYEANFPTAIPPGSTVTLYGYKQSGGSPAPTDPLVGTQGPVKWDGTALVGLSSGADPWATAIPGAYGVGTAGYRLGNATTPLAARSVTASTLRLDAADPLAGSNLAGWSLFITSAASGAGQWAVITSSDTSTDTQHFPAWSSGTTPTGSTVQYYLGTPASDKAGYALSPSGLDLISTTPPAQGVTVNFRQMVVMTYRRWFRKHVATGTTLTGYADDGTTVLTTQSIPAVASSQAQGSA